jgi:hypothetical protein
MTLLEIQYLLHLWNIVYACHHDVRSNFVHHQGELLVQNGVLVELQWGLQLGQLSTNLVKQALEIFAIIQNPWRFGRSVNYEKCSKLDLLLSWIFPDFPKLSIYFSWAEYGIQVYFISEKHWCVRHACQWLTCHMPRVDWPSGVALSVVCALATPPGYARRPC